MERVIKVVLVGDMSTGKSSLLYRLLKEQRLNENFPTVGVEVGSRSFYINDTNIHIQFWDTAGQERFRSVCHQHYKGAEAAILVFDITNRLTFDEVKEHCRRSDVAICLIGNKIDSSPRAVTREQAEKFASINNIQLYEEVSARNGDNVEAAFSRFFLSKSKNKIAFANKDSSLGGRMALSRQDQLLSNASGKCC